MRTLIAAVLLSVGSCGLLLSGCAHSQDDVIAPPLSLHEPMHQHTLSDSAWAANEYRAAQAEMASDSNSDAAPPLR